MRIWKNVLTLTLLGVAAGSAARNPNRRIKRNRSPLPPPRDLW